MIKVSIVNPKESIFEGSAASVRLPGDQGEFEILAFHKPVISLLRRGDIVLDGSQAIRIGRGVVRVHNNEIVALVET